MAMVEAPSTTSLAGPSHALETAVGPDTSDLGDPLRELLVKVHLLFHGAFRAEMEQITADAMKLDECELDALEQDADAGACGISRLLHRYAFLYSCYKFHSTAEDEVNQTCWPVVWVCFCTSFNSEQSYIVPCLISRHPFLKQRCNQSCSESADYSCNGMDITGFRNDSHDHGII